jgi:hypothetical protein
MTKSSSRKTAESVDQAHSLPVRGRQVERLPYNKKEEMALGFGWWSVRQSFVERSRISDVSVAAAPSFLPAGKSGHILVRGGYDKAQCRKGAL